MGQLEVECSCRSLLEVEVEVGEEVGPGSSGPLEVGQSVAGDEEVEAEGAAEAEMERQGRKIWSRRRCGHPLVSTQTLLV